jgi:hypothetical protein
MSQLENDIVEDKRLKAAALWAFERLTDRQKESAENVYFMNAALLMRLVGLDRATALRAAPYVIQDKQEKNLFGPEEDLFTLFIDYEELLFHAKKIKAKKWRNPAALSLAFKEAFPNVPEKRRKRYTSMTPAQIARDCLAQKYKLKVSGEAVKKYLTKLRPYYRVIEMLVDLLHRPRTKATEAFYDTVRLKFEEAFRPSSPSPKP